jgi:hypothetical protein
LVKRIDGLDTVGEQLMEDKGDTSTAGKFVEREILDVTIDGRPVIRAELGDDGQDSAARGITTHRTAERLEFGVEALLLLCDTLLNLWEGVPNMYHEVLEIQLTD